MITISTLEVVLLVAVLVLLAISAMHLIISLRFGVHGSKDCASEVVLPVEEASTPDVDLSQVPVKFFVTCLCKKSNKSNVYRSFITDDFTLGDPSREDLELVKQKVLNEDPNYVDCTILFFGKLRG